MQYIESKYIKIVLSDYNTKIGVEWKTKDGKDHGIRFDIPEEILIIINHHRDNLELVEIN